MITSSTTSRARGGPDSTFNYVLTTETTNRLKGDRTPFEWLSATKEWDAYVNRVRARAGILRNKKVQLLISPNAVELAEKYTALAETAWIAKLAQAIIALHFGWRGGIEQRKRKVTVISGGLTARIRRKYRLNSLLNSDATSKEEAERKNRSDDRHHALDAMVISFIPGWTRDAAKEHFFRFPAQIEKNAREYFGREIAEVIPENICFEKPKIAETIYGARIDNGQKIIIQRAELAKLAYKPINPSKSEYDLKYAAKQIRAIRDAHIQHLLLDFIASDPSEEMWKQFCENFRLTRKDGTPGSRVAHVRVNVGETDEYRDLSKDGTGAYRRAKKGHKGQFVYLDSKGKARVRPVYVFESVFRIRKEVAAQQGIQVIGFFQSGCAVSLAGPVEQTGTRLPAGKYILNTIFTDGRARLTDATGKQSLPLSLDRLAKAGLRRAARE